MDPFVYTASAARVVFGFGTKATLADEIGRLSCGRAVILSTSHQRAEAEALAAQIGDKAVGVFAEAAMHTPSRAPLSLTPIVSSRSAAARPQASAKLSP
jgi:maleylacetate reductase